MTSSFLSGLLLSRLGVGRVLAASCLLTGVALIGYTLVPQCWLMVCLGVFGGLGAVCFLLGVAVLTYLTGVKLTGEAIGGRPLLLAGVMLTVVGLQLTLFGLLAELVVHARNRARRSGPA